MMKRQFILVRVPVALVFFTILAMEIAGCATDQRSSLSNQNSEPLPVYRRGTTFVYSDGTWETVTAVAANMVSWRDNRGYTANGTPDFTRRPLYYQTRTRQGTRIFKPREDLIFRSKEVLWPLKVGSRASFTETGTWSDKRDGSEHFYRSNWSCEVVGIERVTVAAGEFNTWKITCTRYNVSGQGVQSRPKEIRTWYYAPKIGHYVLVTRDYLYDKPSRRQELLAVLPPKEILPTRVGRKMERSFQKALELKVSGSSTSWSIASAAASGGTTPYGTFKLEDGTYCRRYVQDLKFSGEQQTYYGLACRDSGGKWDIPRR